MNLRLLVFGAHPDDCEIRAGGLATKVVASGGSALFVSLTDGSAGHHEIGGVALAQRRLKEARQAASIIGAESIVLDNPDGWLEADLANRKNVIRIIREFGPDVIVCPRLNDYHPDHRYTAQLVQDACYMIMVPNVLPKIPTPAVNPAVVYHIDGFKLPTEFAPDIFINTDEVIEQKLDAILAHESQFFEWLPWIKGFIDQLPTNPRERIHEIRKRERERYLADANRFRTQLIETFGNEEGNSILTIEAFQVSEYGASLSPEIRSAIRSLP